MVRPLFAELLDLLGALALEAGVADRQHLVDEQDLRVDVGRDREPESNRHARRVVLHGCVDEVGETSELDDVVEAALDLLARQTEDRPVQEHVLPATQLGMEAGAQLQQRREAATDRHRALLGKEDPSEALEHRALARAVRADDPERRATRDLERHVLQREELVVAGPTPAQHRSLDVLVALVIEAKALPDVVDRDGGIGHAGRSLARRNGQTNVRRSAFRLPRLVSRDDVDARMEENDRLLRRRPGRIACTSGLRLMSG